MCVSVHFQQYPSHQPREYYCILCFSAWMCCVSVPGCWFNSYGAGWLAGWLTALRHVVLQPPTCCPWLGFHHPLQELSVALPPLAKTHLFITSFPSCCAKFIQAQSMSFFYFVHLMGTVTSDMHTPSYPPVHHCHGNQGVSMANGLLIDFLITMFSNHHPHVLLTSMPSVSVLLNKQAQTWLQRDLINKICKNLGGRAHLWSCYPESNPELMVGEASFLPLSGEDFLSRTDWDFSFQTLVKPSSLHRHRHHHGNTLSLFMGANCSITRMGEEERRLCAEGGDEGGISIYRVQWMYCNVCLLSSAFKLYFRM